MQNPVQNNNCCVCSFVCVCSLFYCRHFYPVQNSCFLVCCFVILDFGDVLGGVDGDESDHTATGAMAAAKKKSKSAPKKATDPKKAVEPKKTTGKGKKGKRAEDTAYNFTEVQEQIGANSPLKVYH